MLRPQVAERAHCVDEGAEHQQRTAIGGLRDLRPLPAAAFERLQFRLFERVDAFVDRAVDLFVIPAAASVTAGSLNNPVTTSTVLSTTWPSQPRVAPRVLAVQRRQMSGNAS